MPRTDLKAALDASLDAFTVLRALRDAHGRVVDFEWTYVNTAAAAILGWPVHDLLGARLLERQPEHRRNGLFERYVQVLETGVPHDVDVRYRGEGIDGWFRNMTVRVADGVAIAFRDVTAQKRAEEERERALDSVREAEARLRAVLDHLPIGVWFADAEGRIRYGNPAGQRIWSGARYVGPEEYASYKAWWADTGAPLRSEDWGLYRAIHRGETSLDELLEIEGFDGERRTLRNAAVPIFDPAGAVAGAVVLNEDVTGQQRTHLALKRSSERLELLARSANIGLWSRGPQGGAELSATCRAQLGLPLTGPLEPGTVWGAIHPDDRGRVRDALHAALAGGAGGYEVECRTRTGRFIHAVATAARDERTGEPRIEGITIDITERRRIEETLAESNRLKDEFLATLSHELRTPLNAVLGWARLLRDDRLDPAQRPRAIETIERNALAQARLVNDILDVSRIITGRLRIEPRRIDPAPSITAALDALRPAAAARQIQLHEALEIDGLQMLVDPDRLQQIVWNLVSNAVKFTAPGGKVRVAARVTGDPADGPGRLEIEVADTGAGIDPAFLPFVFDRFRQADASTTRHHGGLGLGLAIVRHLAELHGGSVVVESAGRDRGATFRVRLPLHRPAPGAAPGIPAAPVVEAAPAAEPVPPDALAGLRVLVADDDTDAREMLDTVLRAAGAEPVLADGAAAAWSALSARPPDVALFDIAMPGEDGYALIRRVRALPDERGGRLPAVAVTAHARAEDRDAARAAGFDAHLSKPIDPAALVATLRGLAAAARSSRR